MWIFKESIADKVVAEHVLEKELTNLGRDGRNEVVLQGEGVSRFHASVTVMKDHVVVRDLDSENGVFINDEQITGEAELRPGNSLQIGDHRLKLERRAKLKKTIEKTFVEDQGKDLKVRLREVSFPPDAPVPSDDETVNMALETASLALKPYLKKMEDGVAFVISASQFEIGRDVESDLVLNHESVSRKHAKLVWRKNQHFLYDTESANGCWVNETKVRGVGLKSGDFIRLGEIVLQYVDPENPPDPALKVPKSTKASAGKKMWITVAAVAGLAILLVVLLMMLNSN